MISNLHVVPFWKADQAIDQHDFLHHSPWQGSMSDIHSFYLLMAGLRRADNLGPLPFLCLLLIWMSMRRASGLSHAILLTTPLSAGQRKEW